MVMKLDIKRTHLARSDRVKAIDFHPTEPWILTSMYNGQVLLYNYQTSAIIKTFEITDVPIRACKFIARKNWFVCGSDDFILRCFNFNTGEKVIQFEAHPDYIRCLCVHPTLPLVLSGSDDMTIRLWNFDNNWKLQQTFEGHSHYVMSLAFNPKDTNTFASSCLDKTVKTWSLGSSRANFTLDAHDKGVNFVEYYPGSDKPYMITTGDDKHVKIWDYQTKACVQILEGHTSNVSFAVFHPEIPVIISGSEDGTIKIWHSGTYRLEQTLSYGLERAWCVGVLKGRNDVCMGFDEGCVVIKMGQEEPAVSMDNSGKIIWAKGTEIQTAVIKGADADAKDGDKLMLSTKDLGNCEVYPSTLQHSPNGRFVVVCGDGEYIIYTALAWRNKAFGSATDFVWSIDSNEYAVRENATTIKVFKQFRERPGHIDTGFSSEGIFGGQLLGVKGSEWVSLYDWTTGGLVRRIDVGGSSDIFWSETGELMALITDEAFYILRFDRQAYQDAVDNGTVNDDESGVEDAFEVIATIHETVTTGRWVGDCFIYTNSANRMNYLVGDQTYTISHFDSGMYMLGYIPRDGRIYLADKDVNVSSYALSLAVVEYQTLIIRGDHDEAANVLETIPADQKTKIARFLEGQGLKELALSVTTDSEQRFELALSLGRLDVALDIARSVDIENKWKTVGDAALASWDFPLAEECFTKARDLSSLLLLHTSTGNAKGLTELAIMATESGQNNIAFVSSLSLGDSSQCIDTLLRTHRYAEAGLFARTYLPSRVEEVVSLWKADLEKHGRSRVARKLQSPEEDTEAFENFQQAIQDEKSSSNNLIELDSGEAESSAQDPSNRETEVNGHDKESLGPMNGEGVVVDAVPDAGE
ncbi:putative COPI vesicle coat beta' subunit [Taphrina deformans PYCC 5710]|uniref:Coatomer subunit beta' n=1 Tax=Taphrina deformans (strain PYCC 5710 / ATCC 11124 / CBS 356.35 / IMI 108563 / JCM 9778 / NBRC 8474) TaxID=1097556 RepID=R4XGE5_TAPDE|nr:putative COPI vesicle coat beta' subunit [Taphrina deformans PYCC 5710]|eukprot:CCG82449.1 putative COPI vesicle coat beta' subunit [Taphrina deformans PYCC 5710]